jgi:hypothetical protein
VLYSLPPSVCFPSRTLPKNSEAVIQRLWQKTHISRVRDESFARTRFLVDHDVWRPNNNMFMRLSHPIISCSLVGGRWGNIRVNLPMHARSAPVYSKYRVRSHATHSASPLRRNRGIETESDPVWALYLDPVVVFALCPVRQDGYLLGKGSSYRLLDMHFVLTVA